MLARGLVALQRVPRTRAFWLLLAINAGGVAYGFYYYLRQFESTDWWLWPLVADSPTAVLLLTVALALNRWGRCPAALALVGAGAMAQVGLWTAIVLPLDAAHLGFDIAVYAIDWTGTFPRGLGVNTWLFWLHLGMVAEAFLLLDALPRPRRTWLAVTAALMGLTILDYALPVTYPWRECAGIYPHTISCAVKGELFAITLALTPLTIGSLAWARRVLTHARNQSEPASSRR